MFKGNHTSTKSKNEVSKSGYEKIRIATGSIYYFFHDPLPLLDNLIEIVIINKENLERPKWSSLNKELKIRFIVRLLQCQNEKMLFYIETTQNVQGNICTKWKGV